MSFGEKLVVIFYRNRSRYWRIKRVLFPSPAEVRFMQIMGAKITIIKRISSRPNNFPLVIVWTLGKALKNAQVKREVRYGKYYVDFANDLNWIIEIDGKAYHMDVVADMDREIYINELLHRHSPYGMRILRVPAFRIYNNPNRVQRDVLEFLTK